MECFADRTAAARAAATALADALRARLAAEARAAIAVSGGTTPAETFGVRYPDAYERLLMEVLRGNPALFMRRDEVEAAWHFIDTIVDGWATSKQKVESYVSGSWGPSASSLLLDRDGRRWYPDE